MDWRQVRGDIRGGLVVSTSCLMFSIANGVLIYSGTFQPMLSRGLAAGLLTTAVVSIVLALTSTLRPIVGTANANTGAPLGAVMASLASSLTQLTGTEAIITVEVAIAFITVFTGIALIALGAARLGAIVRFVPFPVLAGFMGVTGVLILFGSFRLTTGLPVAFSSASKLLGPSQILLISIYLGAAVLTTLVVKNLKHPLALPIFLVACVVVADLVVYGLGYSITNPPVENFFLARSPIASPFELIEPGILFTAPWPHDNSWPLILPLYGSIAAYAFLVVMVTLLTSTGLETALDADADYNHELRAQGIACVASSLLGGFVGNPSVGTTAAGVSAGARGRLTGVVNGLVMIAFLVCGFRLLPFIPRFVAGGLLAQIGFTVMQSWCIASRHRMPRGEWALVLLITAVAIWAGLVPAILAGLLGGCLIFAFDISRIKVVRRVYRLNERASTLVRPPAELATLSVEGRRICFLELKGTLFFGSAYQITERVKALRAVDPPSHVILDLSAVTGCDSTALTVLARMAQKLDVARIGMALAGGPPQIVGLLQSGEAARFGAIHYPTRDLALEAFETMVLAEAMKPAEDVSRAWLAIALGDETLAQRLLPHLEPRDHEPGDYLCRQGETTDTLLLIERGRVAVLVGTTGAATRVRTLGPNSIAGENGFVLGLPRTASLKVERAARVWSLQRSAFEKLQATEPALVIALLRTILHLQAERLAFATRENAALDRQPDELGRASSP